MKGLEALTHLYAKLSCKSSIEDIHENLQEYDIIEKELKALEIIRNNCEYWDFTELFCGIKENNSYEDYLECCKATNETKYASKEEYDLLKEVLK